MSVAKNEQSPNTTSQVTSQWIRRRVEFKTDTSAAARPRRLLATMPKHKNARSNDGQGVTLSPTEVLMSNIAEVYAGKEGKVRRLGLYHAHRRRVRIRE